MKRNARQHSGIALPAIIFMIVIVALLVGAMAQLLNVASGVTDIRLQSSRAFWAAKAGVERAAYHINATDTCAPAAGTYTINGVQVVLAPPFFPPRISNPAEKLITLELQQSKRK